jgi:hypothetical protein
LLPLALHGSLLTASTAYVAGIAGSGISNVVTKQAAMATGIGLGVAAGVNAGLQHIERNVHRAEQGRIAEVAGGYCPARFVWDRDSGYHEAVLGHGRELRLDSNPFLDGHPPLLWGQVRRQEKKLSTASPVQAVPRPAIRR